VNHPKLTPERLLRTAIVYVRQSTPTQVTHHLESQRRQYALEDRARGFGFQRITIIDEDLGKIEKHPDQRIQQSIQLVFEKMTELGRLGMLDGGGTKVQKLRKCVTICREFPCYPKCNIFHTPT
jgi:DNA invertase Pin-like site-specific DNA recombinase